MYDNTLLYKRKGYDMWNLLWPVLIVVAANTIYNISTKSTPGNVDMFASLSVTYLIAAVCSVILFYITGGKKDLLEELSRTNWTAIALGIAVVGLEFGFLCIYRAGWKIGTASLFASVALACVLVIVGALLYKETLSMRQIVGMAVCAVGLFLLVK
jgi:drug/metabolite transporter (DMT)-like permease